MVMRWLSLRRPAAPSSLATRLAGSPAPLGALGLDSAELATLIAAESDPEVLRAAMRRADRVADDRWRIATRERLCDIAPDAGLRVSLIQLLCRTRQGVRAATVMADLTRTPPPGDLAAQMRVQVAAANADWTSATAALAGVDPGAVHHFINDIAMLQLMRGDAGSALDRTRALLRDKPDYGIGAVTAVRAALIGDGRDAARAEQAALGVALREGTEAAAEAEALILLHTGRQREAGHVLADALSRHPRSPRLLGHAVGLLFSEVATDLVAKALDTAAFGPDRSGELLLARVITLSARAEFDRARATLPALRRHSDWGWHTARVHIASQTDDVQGTIRHLVEARAAGVWHGGPEMNAAPFLGLRAPNDPACPEIGRWHAALADWEHANPGYWTQRLRWDIAFGDEDSARAVCAALPKGMRSASEIAPIVHYLERGRLDDDALRAAWRRHVADTAPIAVTAPTAPPLPVEVSWQGTPGDVLLFAVVQNGMEYLPWLIDYYRHLGVDHVFLVDNGSDDGGLEWLRDRAAGHRDVSVFTQPGSFRQAAHGVAWTNHLMQRFGIGHWCFHVDMDEAFVFPGMDEGRSLRDLLAYLDATGAESVPAFMIDIYPESLDLPPNTDPFRASRLIDDDYTFAPFETPPYRFVLGGLRARMASQTLLMTKAPLVRMRPDLRYLSNNHFHTGARMSDLTAALLHYKFVGDLRSRVAEQVTRGEHFMGGRFYRSLQPHLEGEGAKLMSERSRAYLGPRQLVTMGYLTDPPLWRKWHIQARTPAESADNAQGKP